jgi:dihydrofolate reductase
VIVSLIAAVAANGVIGRDNDLPWHLPDDLKHFKELTTGHTVIVGRRTYESVGKPLPNRRWIVLTHRPDYAPPGVEVAPDLDAALALARGEAEVFVAGGGDVFRDALPRADRMYLTHIAADIPGDVVFPAFDAAAWTVVEEEFHPADPRHAYAFTFRRYDRRVR